MSLADRVYKWRDWFPVPVEGFAVKPGRWLLLEGNRHAVTVTLLTLTFASILLLGRFWTFEMQRLFAETNSVQTVLDSFLRGIILLVSIVVSINSIVLTYDITALSTQEERVEGTVEFRREIGRMMDTERSPTDPESFLELMTEVLRERTERLEAVADDIEGPPAAEIVEFIDGVENSLDELEDPLDRVGGAEFGVLWLGLEANFGGHLDELEALWVTHEDSFDEAKDERFEDLIEAFELFETGRQYFKTLYYSREISELSRTLLVISLPAILVTAWTILAIDAGTIPGIGLLGLPPLLVFLAAAFTVSLAPYIVLTAYILRTATVARRTASGGPFVLE